MRSARYQEVDTLAGEVHRLLLERDPKELERRPNSHEPTIAESVALALLELERIASSPRTGLAALPAFASDFLDRRLSKLLLGRYRAAGLVTEFDRRLTDALERGADDERGLERIHRLLSDLDSALSQRQVTGD